jgi:hypothetical protein
VRDQQDRKRRTTWGVLILLLFCSVLLSAAPPPRREVMEILCDEVNSNSVSVTLEPPGEAPEFVAVRVGPGFDLRRAIEDFQAAFRTNRNARFPEPTQTPTDSAEADNPKWLPFRTNLLVDLGPGEGERRIFFAYKYKGEPFDGIWSSRSITIQRGTPTLWIVSPTNYLTSQPIIQLQGLTSRHFNDLRYEQFDSVGKKVASDDQGANMSFDGGYKFKPSDNRFTFFNVNLSAGTNTFVFYGKDEFGNEMTTNTVFVFSTAHDHTPPLIDVHWPKPNAELAGASFTMRGRMDDPTATLEARIRTKDGSTTNEALVERDGYFWFDDVPLALGTNQITLTATDAAGNSSETNFTVIGREGPVVTLDPVNPPDLWKPFIAVTGSVAPPNYDVWINGVQAKVASDGTWSAQRVPILSPNGGTAVFEMSTLPKTATPANKPKASEVVAAQASLSTNAVLLNASAPSCGVFRLHLSDTAGKSFVILASTNLVQWTPILTNVSTAPTFDYTVSTTNQPRRFYQLVPLP